jgi:hypothetical protein
MEMSRKHTKELEAAILGGEMKNAWQPEDRKGQPDGRPPQMKQGDWNYRSPDYLTNYERIFRRSRENAREISEAAACNGDCRTQA